MDFNALPVLAIAISIVICWSLFALLCSFVQEALAQIKAERGRYMKKYLFKQFYDQPNGVNWASMLYMHGTIDLLTRAPHKPTSDIHPRLFAETLIEVVGKAHITQMRIAALDANNTSLPYTNPILNNFKAATLSLKQSDVVSFFQQAMDSAELCKTPDGKPDEAAIYRCLVDQIETWYGQMMERLSLWYKKKTKFNIFMLGSLLALLLNVDSFELWEHFSDSPASRQVMMDYYEANAERLNNLARTGDTTVGHTAMLKSYAKEMDSLSRAAALPIGWEHSVFHKNTWKKAAKEKGKYKNTGEDQSIWSRIWSSILRFFWGVGIVLSKLPGYLLSGFAASAGAPFWFDLLRRAYSSKTPKS